ncbi:MAG TPA: hypothetical protein VE031_09770 [Chthoniobacterales bacterium]|nr:hypothetical protein [Chthoniobacterales bacterium]
MLHLLITLDNYANLLALFLNHASLPALRLHEPNRAYSQEKEKRNHGEGPSFDPAAQVREVVAELENPSFQGLAAGERMENMRLRLQATAISSLQLAQFMRLDFANVGRKTLVDEQVPDFLPVLSRVQGFVLRVACSAELLISRGRLRAITLSDQLNDSFALINLLAQQDPEITRLGAKDVLPNRLIAEKSQRIGHELPGAFQLATDCGNEDERSRRQGTKEVSGCVRLSSRIGRSPPPLRRSSLLYFYRATFDSRSLILALNSPGIPK